jgi:hypothetical protein
MNLTNSWTNHFIAIGNSNEANKNMAFFSDVMKSDQTKSEKIINLIDEDDTVTLVLGKVGQIKILHSFKKFGGTRTRPNLKVGPFSEMEQKQQQLLSTQTKSQHQGKQRSHPATPSSNATQSKN